MSEESEFSEDVEINWINWFCSLEDHQFFCQIDEEYIKQPFNLYGLKNRIKKFQQAFQMILRPDGPQQFQVESPKFIEIYQEATQLYGLIHARYITTPKGMAIMRQRYLSGKFGNCPRVKCEKQNVLPIGISQDLKIARVKVYCPRCQDIYAPKKKFADVDGAFFGTSFPHLLLMTYPDLKPFFRKQLYTPTLYGFKLLKQPTENETQQRLRMQINPEMQPQSKIHQSHKVIPAKKNKKKKKNN